jgi:hypothetical protein
MPAARLCATPTQLFDAVTSHPAPQNSHLQFGAPPMIPDTRPQPPPTTATAAQAELAWARRNRPELLEQPEVAARVKMMQQVWCVCVCVCVCVCSCSYVCVCEGERVFERERLGV